MIDAAYSKVVQESPRESLFKNRYGIAKLFKEEIYLDESTPNPMGKIIFLM